MARGARGLRGIARILVAGIAFTSLSLSPASLLGRPPDGAHGPLPAARTDRLAAALARLRYRHGERADVETARGSERARRITGLDGFGYLGGPEDAVAAFREECQDLLPALGEMPFAGATIVGGVTILRYRRTWQGVPVFGAAEIFHVDAQNRVRFYYGDVPAGVAIETAARIPEEEAVAIALESLPFGSAWRAVGAELGIVPPSRGRAAALAWRIDAHADFPLGACSVYVGAIDGRVISTCDRLVRAGKGKAYEENPATGPLTIVDLAPIGATGRLQGPNAIVLDWARTPMDGDPVGQLRAQADLSGDFLFSASDERTAEVNTYYHMNRIHALFAGFGFHGLDRTFPGMANVELCDLTGWGFPMECDNAYFDPLFPYGGRMGGIFLGKTARGNYALDGDVVAHEYAHAVVAATADLGNVPFWEDRLYPASLNEAYADYFSCALNGNPLQGEYAARIADWADAGGAIRIIDNDNRFPEDVAWGEHETGLIWSGACWEFRDDLAALDPADGAERADRVAFASLLSLTPSAEFSDAGAAFVAAAQSLEGLATADLARRIMNRRGILTGGVAIYRAVQSGQEMTDIADPADVALLSIPQYRIDADAKAAILRVRIEADRNVDLFARFGRPVTGKTDGTIQSDHAAASAASAEEIVIERDSSPALQQGRYYFAIANRATAPAAYTIRFSIEEAPDAPNVIDLASGIGRTGELPGGPLLASTQYRILVASSAGRRLRVMLASAGEVDLYARLGSPIERNFEGHVVADASARTPGGDETIILDRLHPPGIADGTYYFAITNEGRSPARYTLTATIEDGPGGADRTVALTSGREATGSIDEGGGVLGLTQYTIAVPASAEILEVDLSGAVAGSVDVDLYARFNQPVRLNGAIQADHAAATRGPGDEFLRIDGSTAPAIRTGTYYLAIVNPSPGPASFRIRATARGTGGGATVRTLASGVPVNGQAPAGAPDAGAVDDEVFRLQVPAGSPGLRVVIEATPDKSKDLDLAVRFGSAPAVQDDQWIADYIAQGADGLEEVYIPTPEIRTGSYFFAVANYETIPVNFRITATIGDGSLPIAPGIPATGRISAAPAGTVLLDTVDFTIAIPSSQHSLFVELRAPAQPDADIDLYARFGSPVVPGGGGLLADARSESGLPTESILIPAGKTRAGTYYLLVANASPIQVDYEIRATVIDPGVNLAIPLADYQEFLGHVGPAPAGGRALYPIQFTFDVPQALESMTFTFLAVDAADLYARRGQRIGMQGAQVVADASAASGSDGFTAITLDRFTSPALSAGTYYLAAGTSLRSEVMFLLTPESGYFENTDLQSGVAEQGVANGAQGPGFVTLSAKQFTIEVPPGTQSLTVETATTRGNIDLFVRYGANILIDDGQPVADASGNGPTGRETVTISRPSLKAGTYYMAVANFETFQVTYTITATLAGVPNDQRAPAITCPGDMVQDGTELFGKVVTFQVRATDTVDPNPIIYVDPPSGTRFPYGTTEVVATARDWFGNTSTCRFDVTIRDRTAPQVSCPADIEATEDAPGAGARVEFQVAVLDNGDPDPKVTATPASGSVFSAGTTEVVCVAEDRFGNKAECRFRVSVRGSGAPVFLRGDVDGSGRLELGDPIQVLEYLYSGRKLACVKAADANDDGRMDLGDPIYILNFIFAGGPRPKPPYPAPGTDPTPDDLPCTR